MKKDFLIFILIFLFCIPLKTEAKTALSEKDYFSISINTIRQLDEISFSEVIIDNIEKIENKKDKDRLQAMTAFVLYMGGVNVFFGKEKDNKQIKNLKRDSISKTGWNILYRYALGKDNNLTNKDIFNIFSEYIKVNQDLFDLFSACYFGSEIPLRYEMNFEGAS